MKSDEEATFRKFQRMRFPQHACELPPMPDRVFPQLPPNASSWQRCVRFLQHQLVAWRRSRPVRLMRPSNMQFEYEQAHHVRRKQWWVIHPMSRFFMLWQAIIIVSIFVGLLVWPMTRAFGRWRLAFGTDDPTKMVPEWTTIDPEDIQKHLDNFEKIEKINEIIIAAESLIYWVHILFKFNTGYINHQANRVVMTPSKIMRRYLRTTFVIDVMSCCLYFNEGHSRVFYTIFDINKMIYPREQAYRCISIGLGMLHVLRVYELYVCLRQWMDFLKFTRNWRTIVELSLCYILFVHWMACLSVLWPIQIQGPRLFSKNSNSWLNDRSLGMLYPNKSVTEKYLTALTRVVAITRGTEVVHTEKGKTTEDYILLAITIWAGWIFQYICLAVIIEAVGWIARPEIKLPQVMQEVHNYMRQRQLPVHLRKKILLYYSHTMQGRYVRVRAVLANMPYSMRQAVKVACCHRLVSSSALFRNVPKALVYAIIECLEEELYLPSDVVYTYRSEAKAMFFLSTGTVAVLAPTGEEVGHLDDGAYFGEMELVSAEKRRVLSVIAIEVCEVFVLSRHNFRRLFKPHPRLYNRLRAASLQRATELMEWDDMMRRDIAYSMADENDDDDDDVNKNVKRHTNF